MPEFNERQRDAIDHKDGPCMVIAGPGSGKTATLAGRVWNLVHEKGVPEECILVVTFTRDAAEEMRKRYLDMKGSKWTGINFGTFHSIFLSILKRGYNLPEDCVVTKAEQFDILKEAIKYRKLKIEIERDTLESALSEIGFVKNSGTDISEYGSKICDKLDFEILFREYETHLKKQGKLDFDDMLVKTKRLLEKNEKILTRYRKLFQYILVDEFQDINPLQYDIIKLLAEPLNNIFVVGDDDQSIYGFRGASPELMQTFCEDYPDCRRILLNMNYRSGKSIVDLSLRLMNKSDGRFIKAVTSASESIGKVSIKRYADRKEEYEGVVKNILDYRDTGMDLSDIAILYRTNSGGRKIMEFLLDHNIPFTSKSIPGSIYEHRVSLDMLTYLRLAHGDNDREGFIRILNRPYRYLKREILKDQVVDLKELIKGFDPTGNEGTRLDELFEDLRKIGMLKPAQAIYYIRKNMKYDSYIEDYASGINSEAGDMLEVLDDLMEDAAKYDTYEQWLTHINERKEQILKHRKERSEKQGKVYMSTMHGAKGLEFDAVFIIDANEGVMPHSKAGSDEDIKEERRMFYVAMTRARRYLHIDCTKLRYRKPCSHSRFIDEIVYRKEK